MTHSTLLKAAAAPMLALLLAGACSSSSGGPSGKEGFCKTNAEINDRLGSAKSLDDQIAAFKDLEPKFDSYVANAPADVKTEAVALVAAARNAVKNNDATPFQTDAGLRQAGQKVDAFCGGASDTSTSASTNATDATQANPSTSVTAPAEFTLTVADGWTQTVGLEGITGYEHAGDDASLKINRTLDESDLAAYLDATVAAQGMPDPSKPEPVTVGGETGLTQGGDFEAKGTSGHISFTVVQHAGKRYTIVYSAPSPAVFLAHAPEVQAMLDSLQFTP